MRFNHYFSKNIKTPKKVWPCATRLDAKDETLHIHLGLCDVKSPKIISDRRFKGLVNRKGEQK